MAREHSGLGHSVADRAHECCRVHDADHRFMLDGLADCGFSAPQRTADRGPLGCRTV